MNEKFKYLINKIMSKQNFEELVLQKLTNMETKIDNIELDVKVLKDDVKILKEDVNVLKVKTDNLEKWIHNLNVKTSIMDRKIDWLYSEMNNLEWAIELNTSYINQSFKTMSSNMFSYDKNFR